MIRLARRNEIPRLLEIYETAKQFMRRNGNYAQWTGAYPGAADLLADIDARQLYVIESFHDICACFMLSDGPDPTYATIYDGAFRSDAPYGVIHRIASDGSAHGVLAQSVAFARQRYDHLRIDTHEDNIPMQGALAKEGFRYCGRIIIADGTPRIAFDWLKE